MPPRAIRVEDSVVAEAVRYVINGVVATGIHYATLVFNLRVLDMPSAGVANLCAAVLGISASFLGSRYFVFRRSDTDILRQAARFGLLYGTIAMLHGSILYLWSDVGDLDYRIGFLLALALQIILSYCGNKILVFK